MVRTNHTFFWHRIPVFRLLLPLVVGIGLGIAYPQLNFLLAGLLTAGLFVSVLLLKVDWIQSSLLFLLMTGFGYLLAVQSTDRIWGDHVSKMSDHGHGFMKATVVSRPVETEKTFRVELATHCFDSTARPYRAKVLAYFLKDSSDWKIQFGDKVLIQGRLDSISYALNPGQFDYGQYLAGRQIHYQLFLHRDDWTLLGSSAGLMGVLQKAQSKTIALFDRFGIEGENRAVISALVVGFKNDLSRDQRQAFADSGAMHVLAVSGLHVGIFYLLLSLILKPLGSRKYVVKGLITLFILWSYAMLTGLSPSVTRATTMFSFVVVGQMFNRSSNIYNTLAASAFFLLVIDPYLLLEVGFQLSYAAVFGIVFFQPRILAWWSPRHWLLKKIWELTSVSIAAQLITLPLSLYYFHQFPVYFLVSNLVVIPMVMLLLPSAMLLLAISWREAAASMIGWLVDGMLTVLNKCVALLAGFPFATWSQINVNEFQLVLLYCLLFGFSLFLIQKHRRYLQFSLVCVVFLFAESNLRLYQRNQQSGLVVYASRSGWALDFIRGDEHVTVHDDISMEDLAYLTLPIERIFGVKPDASAPSLSDAGRFWEFNDQQILLVDSILRIEDTMDVDVLILSERSAQHPKVLLAMTSPEWLVLSPQVDWRSRNYWKKLAVENGLEVWDQKEEGAFVSID